MELSHFSHSYITDELIIAKHDGTKSWQKPLTSVDESKVETRIGISKLQNSKF